MFKEKYPITKKGLSHKLFKLGEEREFHMKRYQRWLDKKAEYEGYLKELYENKDQSLYDELQRIESKIAALQGEIEKAGGEE